jgi:hypothetical protein
MLCAAKCYWPGIARAELERVAARAEEGLLQPGVRDVSYRGAVLFADDDLVLCLFEGSSPMAVKRARDRLGIPCERVMDSVWLEAGREDLKGAMR